MQPFDSLPRHNLGLYRLKNVVGHSKELAQLSAWLEQHPVVAITGPSGAGKSTLATRLAVQEAAKFEEGILWISATGDTDFNFYDIVRAIEDVLATGITGQPVSAWPLYVLQQIFGFNRLLILDELTEADWGTVNTIIAMIGQIKSSGLGRFVLIGRSLPQPLLDIVGEAHLILGGLEESEVQQWLKLHQDVFPILSENSPMLHRFTGGHPLALKLVAGLWESRDWGQLFDLVSVQAPGDWEARLKATVIAALAALGREHPEDVRLLTRCTQAWGGFDADAIKNLYWQNAPNDASLIITLQRLLMRGLLLYNPQANRYFIHPLIRRYLNVADYAGLPAGKQAELSLAHATYYLRIARRYNKVSSDQWAALDEEWGNIRKAFDFLAAKFEQRLDMSAEEALARIDDLTAVPISPQFGEILILLRDYALTLRKYIVLRHPPEGYHWLAAGMVAARILGTAYTQAGNQTDHSRQTEALLGKGLAAMAFTRQDYETAQIWYCNSLLYFREAEDHRRTVEVLRSLGMVLQAMGLPDEALSTYQDGLQVATADGLDDERAAIQAEIGAIYYEKQDFDQAVEWHQKALELEQEIDRPSGQAERHNDLGRTLEAINLFEQAIQHYTIAAQLYQTMNDNFGLSVTYDNLGAVYYHSGRLKEALAWYEQDLAIIDGLGNWFDMAAILHNMGHVAMDMDDFQAAVGYFTRSRDIYLQFGQLELADEEQLLIDTIQDRHTSAG